MDQQLRYCRGFRCKNEKLKFLGSVAVSGGDAFLGIRGQAVETPKMRDLILLGAREAHWMFGEDGRGG